MEVINAIGRRKSAVARVYLTEGTGRSQSTRKILRHISHQQSFAM